MSEEIIKEEAVKEETIKEEIIKGEIIKKGTVNEEVKAGNERIDGAQAGPRFLDYETPKDKAGNEKIDIAQAAKAKAPKSREKTKSGSWIKRVLTARNAGGVILRIIIMLLIPYAYLFLCGLVFDMWLKMYSMTTFIFVSLMVFWAIAIVLSICSIVWTAKARKAGKHNNSYLHSNIRTKNKGGKQAR